MRHARSLLAASDDLPIKTALPVHRGKVRSVYWLDAVDSRRLIAARDYPVVADAPLAVMVISDRLSAFECLWKGQGGLNGVPGKGGALNAIAQYWFARFAQQGLADSPILEVPHPYVWVVQRARPVRIEAIARQYLTGSMWRRYQAGEREFGGMRLADGMQAHARLPDLLLTPSTKGRVRGVAGVAEQEDAPVTRRQLLAHRAAFNFKAAADIDRYERLLRQGFGLIDADLAKIGQILVDTKFEFGYVADATGHERLICIDEVGTPDSSRLWDAAQYRQGRVVENSKEGFRQALCRHFSDDPDILLNPARLPERTALAAQTKLPPKMLLDLSAIYLDMARKITGKPLKKIENPRAEIIDVLHSQYGLIA